MIQRRFVKFLRELGGQKITGSCERLPEQTPTIEEFQLDLGTTVGALAFKNPVMTAAGTSGFGSELGAFFELSDLGAVVVKSISAFKWEGNPGPRLVPLDAGMLNSVGLQGPGVDAWISHYLPLLEKHKVNIIVSIWGRTVDEFAAAAQLLAPVAQRVAAVEVNLSCPNLEERSKLFAHSVQLTSAVTEAVVAAGIPVVAKLSPNTHLISEIAGAAIGAGATAVTLTNTLVGIAIDVQGRKPILGGVGGGLSGKALGPVALRAVFDLHRHNPEIPIVGVGGISTGREALAMIMAGASAIQVGTANFADPRAPRTVLAELVSLCADLGISRISDVVGVANRA